MPSQKKSSRKLAAILFADVVGYTALMQKEEEAASRQLHRFQDEINKHVIIYNGTIVNFYGDGALCTFDNPLEAMRCAIQLQSDFQSDPSVPVRIGIHSGTVVTEGDKVYGDNINVASRIESMGVPGAILVSKKVRDELKNQPDLLMPSLGSFEFKNVEEPMEIFALANEGFTVPKREEMKGKIKDSSRNKSKNKWLIPAAAITISLISFVGWNMYLKNDVSGLSENTEIPGALSKEVRGKRVAVMVFENLTMDPSMDAFGKMTSDWITKGLMETSKVNVISGANIQSKIQMAGIGQGAAKKLANAIGVGVILEGRYYLQEGQLIIHINIVDAVSGEVIHAMDPIQGPKDNMLKLLEQLTQDILGYWAIEKQTRFLQNPPKYEAYQEWIKGDFIFYTDPHQSEIYLKKAIELDSTFYIPLLKLVPLYGNMRRMDAYKAILDYLDTKKSNFTQWEKLRYNTFRSRLDCQFIEAAESAEKRFMMDPSDVTGNNNAAQHYLQANQPANALRVLNVYDTRLRNMETKASARESWISMAHYFMGAYEESNEVIENYPFEWIQSLLINVHFGSIIKLGRYDEIIPTMEYYKSRKVRERGGGELKEAFYLVRICNLLLLEGQDSLATIYAIELMKWTDRDKEDPDYLINKGRAYYYQGLYNEALSTWSKIDEESKEWIVLRYMGICYAKIGNTEKAHELIEIIGEKNITLGRIQYGQASVFANLGDHEKALSLLIKAPDNCYPFFVNRYNFDDTLKPLFDYPEFQELVRPKG